MYRQFQNFSRLSKRRNKWLVPLGMFVVGGMSMFVLLSSYNAMQVSMSVIQQFDLEYKNKTLGSKFVRDISAKMRLNKLIDKPTNKQTKQIKILCFVKTQPNNYETRATAVKNTWGKRCDKLLFMSSEADDKLPAINLFPERHQAESRKLLTEKVFRALKYIYTYYLNDYDWFHEADDDTYIIVDNLRGFLSTKNPKDPIYFGHRFMKYMPQGYTSGGAGYVMSREALRRIRDNGPILNMCHTRGAASDAHIGRCLSAVGVKLGSSVDSKGRSRYHCMDIEPFIFGGFPRWYKNYTAKGDGYKSNWIADYPISFHYVNPGKMYTLELLLHQTRIHGEADSPRPLFH